MASSSRNRRSRSRSSQNYSQSDHGSDSEATHYEHPNQPPPIVVAPPAWFPYHPWLQFPIERDFPSPGFLYSQASQLQGRQPCAVRFLDFGDHLVSGLVDLVSGYLHHEVMDPAGNLTFTDHSLRSLASIAEPSYPVLWLEFFASFQFDPTSRDFGNPRYITFRLGGERRFCSLYEFGMRLGLYTYPFSISSAFQEHLREGLVISSDDYNVVEFWGTIADGIFDGDAVASSIRSVAHRFLARY